MKSVSIVNTRGSVQWNDGVFELASDSGDGAILPTWTAVDTNNVRTQRELMENMRKDGWNVEVCPTVSHGIRGLNLFIPVPPVRPIEANMPHLGVNIGLPTESQSLLTDPLKSAPSLNDPSD